MGSKILAPHYLRLERDIRGEPSSVWRALTDVHELRAWWGVPVCRYTPGVGGGFELCYMGRRRVDLFVFNAWDAGWRVGGQWRYDRTDGEIDETISLKTTDDYVVVTLEQSGFQTFGDESVRIFGRRKTDNYARLERLRDWIEQRIPANLARMPVA